ncbi:hypothetical protein K504DRAFT_531123 [Pleomassaria siparia CBS 279.74]|uniref:Uncharacterized protein n=1 Tax=Pleomassaria siparia CBS 279.74 TaxID=1314801 RepID=A0A6G1KH48_9PLEO|nr:hypothetical protein K504DRAFT_531123 [Pleomassaria siparia CBS 279.74]
MSHAANDDDELNSSDIEFGPAPMSRFAYAGKKSIDKMLGTASVDRLESKKASKHLQMTAKSPNTQYAVTLWHNRFLEFRRNTLEITNAETATPNGEQIEGFLASIVKHVKPLSGGVPNYDWLRTGLGRLIHACVFHYTDFKLNPTDHSRIAAVIETLLREGKLTKKVKRDKTWLGSHLHVLLASALGARAGDITKGKHDVHDEAFLAYEDLRISIVNGQGIESFIMMVKLRNQKGFKGDGHNVASAKLSMLNDPTTNVVCPVKIMLINALRSGTVKEKTILDLVQNTSARRDRTNGLLGKLCRQAGIIPKVRPHDMHRGETKDIANLPAKDLSMAAESQMTFKTPFLPPLTTPNGYLPPTTPRTPRQVDELCAKYGMNPSIPKDRARATHKAESDAQAAWRAETNYVDTTKVATADSVTQGTDSGTARTNTKQTKGSIYEDDGSEEEYENGDAYDAAATMSY